MAERPDESGFERWAGLHFDLKRGEIWAVDADGNRERAPVFKAVIEAMRCIPYSPERANGIQAGAWNICSAAMFAGMEDQPNLQQNRGGTAADLEELHGAHERLVFLWRYFSGMHLGAWEALGKVDPKGLRNFKKDVARWSRRAHEAELELDKTVHQPSLKGRPREEIMAAIRPVALREFEHLTGDAVVPKHLDYPALKKYFSALLEALDLDPKNGESQARTAVEERDASPD